MALDEEYHSCFTISVNIQLIQLEQNQIDPMTSKCPIIKNMAMTRFEPESNNSTS